MLPLDPQLQALHSTAKMVRSRVGNISPLETPSFHLWGHTDRVVSGADQGKKESVFLCVWPELLARKSLPEVKMRKAGMNDGS